MHPAIHLPLAGDALPLASLNNMSQTTARDSVEVMG